MEGFFYIIQTPDVDLGVYKIGKTVQSDPNKRLCAYPKFSAVKYTIAVKDADGFEDYAMRKFRTIFKRRLEYGLEYYQGDLVKMIDTAHQMWMKYGHADEIKLDKTIERCKPNGWQAFCNDWLSTNYTKNIDLDIAYNAYVNMMEKEFMTIDYASRDVFCIYLVQCLK